MASFSRTLFAFSRKAPRVTFVWGEAYLREVVVSRFRGLAGDGMSLVSLSAADTPEADIWAACVQYALDPGQSTFVVVRDAERLDLSRLLDWLAGARRQPRAHLLFVTSWARWPRDGEGEFQHKAVRAALSKSSQVLLSDCSFPVTEGPREKAQVEALQTLQPLLGPLDCRQIIQHCRGDFPLAVQVSLRIEVLRTRRQVRVSKPVLDQLVIAPPEDNYVRSLLRGDVRAALEAASSVDASAAILRLSTDLSKMQLLSRARAQVRGGEVAQQMVKVGKLSNLPRQFVSEYWLAAHKYEQVDRCWAALYRADAELFRGIPEAVRERAHPADGRGIMETLVLEWI